MQAESPSKILVVDDEPSLELIIRQKFKKYIKENKIEFVFALNGKEALIKLENDKEIGIILTDLNMPEMDGLTLLEKISQQYNTYRAIVISAYGDMRNIRSAMNKGACDFIMKPIDLHDLEITLVNAIEKYKQLKTSALESVMLIEFNKELHIAKEIQQSFIPHHFEVPNKNITLLGEMIPAKEVGGDFFDFFSISNDLLGFNIGDVAGKGIGAALFMSMSRTLLRIVGLHTLSPLECIKETNEILSQNNDTNMFLTVFYGMLNSETGEFTYCNAGHLPAYILGLDQSVKKISENEGMALGFFGNLQKDHFSHSEKKIQLKKGDIIVLYTDGVNEAINSKCELYGFTRLEEYLKRASRYSLPDLVNGLKEDIYKFTDGSKQSDDIAIFCIRYD